MTDTSPDTPPDEPRAASRARSWSQFWQHRRLLNATPHEAERHGGWLLWRRVEGGVAGGETEPIQIWLEPSSLVLSHPAEVGEPSIEHGRIPFDQLQVKPVSLARFSIGSRATEMAPFEIEGDIEHLCMIMHAISDAIAASLAADAGHRSL